MLREYEILIDKIKEHCLGKKNIAVYGPTANELTVEFLSFAMSDHPHQNYTVIKLKLKYTRWNTLTISSSEINFRNNISCVLFNVLKPKTQFDEFLKTALEVVKFIINAHNGGGGNTKIPYESVMDYINTLAAINNNI
jgi:hypothetical protein